MTPSRADVIKAARVIRTYCRSRKDCEYRNNKCPLDGKGCMKLPENWELGGKQ